MADASVRMNVGSQGASLRTISRELRAMDDAKVTGIFKKRLTDAAGPFVPAVRASALAIPVKVDGRHTGLRARIAACAAVASWQDAPREVAVAVEIQPQHMPDREKSLPLLMQGVGVGRRGDSRWRHPVFGRNKDPWVQQPPHPYFFQAAGGFGRAAGAAMQRALDDITRQING
jgi:hypothetical protein